MIVAVNGVLHLRILNGDAQAPIDVRAYSRIVVRLASDRPVGS